MVVETLIRQCVVMLAVLATVASLPGCAGPPAPPAHVVLVTVDTLRADHMGLYGYAQPTTPTIDAIGAEGVVFENAVPTCPATSPSVAAMLTGIYRASHGVWQNTTVLQPAVTTLAEILKAHGYQTAGVVSNPAISASAGSD